MNTLIDRARSIGLAIGALWLTTASAAFAIWSLIVIRTPAAKGTLIGALVIATALIATGVVVTRATLHLPGGVSPRTREEGRAIRRRFAWVFGAELAALAVVNPILAFTGHFKLLPSLDVMIIGIHFLPLARIFRVPRYYVTGLLFCAIPTAMLLSMSQHARVGNAVAWFVIPGLGCGLVGAATAAAGLREAWQSVIALRPAPQH